MQHPAIRRLLPPGSEPAQHSAAAGAAEAPQQPNLLVFPVRSDMPQFLGVPLLFAGRFETMAGPWDVDEQMLADYASVEHGGSYDPVNVYPATLNTDHADYAGPAYGLIARAYVDKFRGETCLLGDIVNVNYWLAAEIDAGHWPCRSGELWDAPEDKPEWWFYGKHRRYLCGLAALGQLRPAVPGLGFWPQSVVPGADSAQENYPVIPFLEVAALGATRQAKHCRMFSIHPPEAAPMTSPGASDPTVAGGAGTSAGAPSPEVAALQARTTALEQQNAQLQQQLASEEMARLSEKAATRLNELVKSGKVTPGELPTLQEQLSDALGRQPLTVQAADGSGETRGKHPVDLFFASLEARPVAISYGRDSSLLAGSQEIISSGQQSAIKETLKAKLGLSDDDLKRADAALAAGGAE